MSIIKHESFNNLFLLKNDIFVKYFGKNKHGKELRKLSHGEMSKLKKLLN